jgi:hypothetical protein
VLGAHLDPLARGARHARWVAHPSGLRHAAGPGAQDRHDLDLVVFGRDSSGRGRVLAIGEAKSSDILGRGHLRRLEQPRELLMARDERAGDGLKLLFSGSDFSPALTEQTLDRDDVELIDLERLYQGS